jgi:UPF0755 protein
MTAAGRTLAGLALLAGVAGLAGWMTTPPGPGPAQVVEIPQGTGTAEIGRLLSARGLVRSGVAFTLYARALGLDGRLQAGEYRISPEEDIPKILRRLASGDVVRHPLVLPEGLTAAEVAARIEHLGLGRAARILLLVREPERFWIPQMRGNRSGSLEGYLFPDTYLLPKGLGEERIVRIFVDRFRQATGALLEGPLPLGLEPHEVVTVASLVEREAKRPEERGRIAGVIYNRLRAGMPLQIDATVLYALGAHRPVVRQADLLVDSPYNTYRRIGLPPGPIANPGLAALRAAVEPERHAFFYYVARPDGTHIFSRTLEEHLQAIRKVRGEP